MPEQTIASSSGGGSSFRARKEFKKLKEEEKEKAAVDIQKMMRGYLARKEFNSLKEEKKGKAAVDIQRVGRGYIARQRAKELKTKESVEKLAGQGGHDSFVTTEIKQAGHDDPNLLLVKIASESQDITKSLQEHDSDISNTHIIGHSQFDPNKNVDFKMPIDVFSLACKKKTVLAQIAKCRNNAIGDNEQDIFELVSLVLAGNKPVSKETLLEACVIAAYRGSEKIAAEIIKQSAFDPISTLIQLAEGVDEIITALKVKTIGNSSELTNILRGIIGHQNFDPHATIKIKKLFNKTETQTVTQYIEGCINEYVGNESLIKEILAMISGT